MEYFSTVCGTMGAYNIMYLWWHYNMVCVVVHITIKIFHTHTLTHTRERENICFMDTYVRTHISDLRQDMLTLQIIGIMDNIWQHQGLDLRSVCVCGFMFASCACLCCCLYLFWCASVCKFVSERSEELT